MIEVFVFTIIHFMPFFLHAFDIRSAVVFSLGSSESAIVIIATVIGFFLRSKSCSTKNSLNFGICIFAILGCDLFSYVIFSR